VSGYANVPDDALVRMARNSDEQIDYWERALREARTAVARAEGMMAHWTGQRDEQYQALDDRDAVSMRYGTETHNDPCPAGFDLIPASKPTEPQEGR
jgi:hypothetical protein